MLLMYDEIRVVHFLLTSGMSYLSTVLSMSEILQQQTRWEFRGVYFPKDFLSSSLSLFFLTYFWHFIRAGRSIPRGCTVSALYHVNPDTKGTLCHFIFLRLQKTLAFHCCLCVRGHFLLMAPPPCCFLL